MTKDAMSLADQLCTEICHGFQAGQIGQVLVVDREVEIEALLGNRGNALIESAFQIDDRVDTESRSARPFRNGR